MSGFISKKQANSVHFRYRFKLTTNQDPISFSSSFTYPAIVGLEKSRKIAEQLTAKAFVTLKTFKGRAVALESLAEFLLKRDK